MSADPKSNIVSELQFRQNMIAEANIHQNPMQLAYLNELAKDKRVTRSMFIRYFDEFCQNPQLLQVETERLQRYPYYILAREFNGTTIDNVNCGKYFIQLGNAANQAQNAEDESFNLGNLIDLSKDVTSELKKLFIFEILSEVEQQDLIAALTDLRKSEILTNDDCSKVIAVHTVRALLLRMLLGNESVADLTENQNEQKRLKSLYEEVDNFVHICFKELCAHDKIQLLNHLISPSGIGPMDTDTDIMAIDGKLHKITKAKMALTIEVKGDMVKNPLPGSLITDISVDVDGKPEVKVSATHPILMSFYNAKDESEALGLISRPERAIVEYAYHISKSAAQPQKFVDFPAHDDFKQMVLLLANPYELDDLWVERKKKEKEESSNVLDPQLGILNLIISALENNSDQKTYCETNFGFKLEQLEDLRDVVVRMNEELKHGAASTITPKAAKEYVAATMQAFSVVAEASQLAKKLANAEPSVVEQNIGAGAALSQKIEQASKRYVNAEARLQKDIKRECYDTHRSWASKQKLMALSAGLTGTGAAVVGSLVVTSVALGLLSNPVGWGILAIGAGVLVGAALCYAYAHRNDKKAETIKKAVTPVAEGNIESKGQDWKKQRKEAHNSFCEFFSTKAEELKIAQQLAAAKEAVEQSGAIPVVPVK